MIDIEEYTPTIKAIAEDAIAHPSVLSYVKASSTPTKEIRQQTNWKTFE